MKKALFFGLFFFYSLQTITAQVNTEIYRPSNKNQGWVGQIRASLSLNRGNGNNDIFLGSFRNSYIHKRHLVFGIASYNFGQTRSADGATNVFRRKGFLYGKYNYSIDRDSASRWNLEIFGQNEVNEFIRLRNRNLGGIGVRWDIVEVPQKVSLSIGSSAMYEFEQVQEDTRDVLYPTQTNFWRWSNYVSLTYILHQKATTFLSLVAYLQPAFYDISNRDTFSLTDNYRFLMNASLRTSITKALSFGMTLKYRNASFIQSFLKNFDLSLRSNLTINF